MQYTIRPVVESDYPSIVAMINAQVPEPTTVEEYARQQQILADGGHWQLRLAAVGETGILLGYGMVAGGPLFQPGTSQIKLRVDRAHRGQRIGVALLEQLEAFAREHKAFRLESSVSDDDPGSCQWAADQGYVTKHHLFESMLTLAEVDLGPFQGVKQAAESAGIRFTTLAAEGASEQLYADLAELLWEFVQDVPDFEQRPKSAVVAWLNMLRKDPSWDPAAVFLAMDGDRIAAMAGLQRKPSGAYYNSVTGVARAYRGRGLALAVKLSTLEYALEHGVPYLRTTNHSANQRMLAVNRKLGYRPEPGHYQLEKLLA